MCQDGAGYSGGVCHRRVQALVSPVRQVGSHRHSSFDPCNLQEWTSFLFSNEKETIIEEWFCRLVTWIKILLQNENGDWVKNGKICSSCYLQLKMIEAFINNYVRLWNIYYVPLLNTLSSNTSKYFPPGCLRQPNCRLLLCYLNVYFLTSTIIFWLIDFTRKKGLKNFIHLWMHFIFLFLFKSPLFLQDPLPPLTWGKIHFLEILGIPDVSLYGWSAEEVCASVRLRSEQYELFHWSTVNSYQSWAPSGWLSVQVNWYRSQILKIATLANPTVCQSRDTSSLKDFKRRFVIVEIWEVERVWWRLGDSYQELLRLGTDGWTPPEFLSTGQQTLLSVYIQNTWDHAVY